MHEFDMFAFQIPDFPTPSFPKTTDRKLFKFPLLFPLIARGFVPVWKLGDIDRLSIDLSWKEKAELMLMFQWILSNNTKLYCSADERQNLMTEKIYIHVSTAVNKKQW